MSGLNKSPADDSPGYPLGAPQDNEGAVTSLGLAQGDLGGKLIHDWPSVISRI